MRGKLILVTALLWGFVVSAAHSQTLEAARDDQINRLTNYVVDAIMPSGLVRDSLVLNGSSFHPATPDAAGFVLLGLSALDHLDKLPTAEQRVINILNAYAGHTPGVTPDRSADGHYIHWMNTANGTRASGGWTVEYTTIGSALLVAGAQFAKNHFSDNATIAALADELTSTTDFNAAIHPNLGGGIYRTMNQFGGGTGGTALHWNEYMLVESLAVRQVGDNDRAWSIKDLWLDVDTLPKRSFGGIPTLTDNLGSYLPAFLVQQQHFFNGDFRHSTEFEQFFENHKNADELYSSNNLGQSFRYGITAGLIPDNSATQSRYHADELFDHPGNVFSPEAVAAWGDMDTLLQFYNSQFPTSDTRYRYGLLRESAMYPTWIPPDIGLVDHLFLLFGLVESIDPDFFADRLFTALVDGDFDYDGDVDGRDFLVWQRGDSPTGPLSPVDLAAWQANYGGPLPIAAFSVPEPTAAAFLVLLTGMFSIRRGR
jgi:hypothetical protein